MERRRLGCLPLAEERKEGVARPSNSKSTRGPITLSTHGVDGKRAVKIGWGPEVVNPKLKVPKRTSGAWDAFTK